MELKDKVVLLAAALFTFGPLAGGADAAIFLDFNYNVQQDRSIITYSGSWDTFSANAELTYDLNKITQNEIYALTGLAAVYIPSSNPIGANLPLNLLTPTSVTGDNFGFLHNAYGASLYAPSGYTAGASIQGSMSFDGIDLEELGFTYHSGTASYGTGVLSGMGPGNDVTWDVRVTTIPEPASAALLALGGMAVALRRRRGE